MRLDRFISNVTSFSRKEVKARILQRRVKVDGAIIKDCKYAVNENSLVLLDDMPVEAQASRYFMLYKPAGYISATKDANQPTALDLLDEPNKHQLHIAGRLDIDTTGLLIITDDGQWSHRLTSPNSNKPKVYLVDTAESITPESIAQFEKGVYLKYEDQTTKPAHLEILSDKQARLSIYEGKYHQVKRMFGAMGNKVVALHRERIGDIKLDALLTSGEYRALNTAEIETI